jgi:membrane glycosyltransferase
LNPHVNVASDLTITFRRVTFFALSIGTALLMLFLVHQTLAATIPLVIRIIILGLFALTLPWMVVGFWNAIIGLLICQCVKDPIDFILPKNMQLSDTSPITHSTAILLCIRNESPTRLIRNLQAMLDGLVNDHLGSFFHVYVLSDTNANGKNKI